MMPDFTPVFYFALIGMVLLTALILTGLLATPLLFLGFGASALIYTFGVCVPICALALYFLIR